jgi:hypothetical protein
VDFHTDRKKGDHVRLAIKSAAAAAALSAAVVAGTAGTAIASPSDTLRGTVTAGPCQTSLYSYRGSDGHDYAYYNAGNFSFQGAWCRFYMIQEYNGGPSYYDDTNVSPLHSYESPARYDGPMYGHSADMRACIGDPSGGHACTAGY